MGPASEEAGPFLLRRAGIAVGAWKGPHFCAGYSKAGAASRVQPCRSATSRDEPSDINLSCPGQQVNRQKPFRPAPLSCDDGEGPANGRLVCASPMPPRAGSRRSRLTGRSASLTLELQVLMFPLSVCLAIPQCRIALPFGCSKGCKNGCRKKRRKTLKILCLRTDKPDDNCGFST